MRFRSSGSVFFPTNLHYFVKSDPDPHQSEKPDPGSNPHQNEKLDEKNPYQSGADPQSFSKTVKNMVVNRQIILKLLAQPCF